MPEHKAKRRVETREELIRARGSLWLLLATLALLEFGYPVTYYGTIWTYAYLLVYGGLCIFAYRLVSLDPRGQAHLPVLGALVLIAGTWFAVRQEDATAQAAALATVGLLQLALLVTLASVIISPPPRARTVDLLLVAVCGYLLLGGVFGSAAAVMEFGTPGSYLDPNSPVGVVTWQSLAYGSHVTLATLGYGDVVPVEPWARSMWSLEAVLGTLFVAVVVARLVGVARPREREAPADDLPASS